MPARSIVIRNCLLSIASLFIVLFWIWWLHASYVPRWDFDFGAARRQSLNSGKPILLEFSATWCGPCKQMKETTLRDPAVRRMLGQYELVSLDVDSYPEQTKLLNVSSIPSFFVIDGRTGRVIKEDRRGFLTPEEFCIWLSGRPQRP